MNPFSIWKSFAAAFVLLSLVSFAWGQEATRYVCLTLDNKMVRCGQLISDDGREVTLESPSLGRIIVPKIQVVRMVDSPEGTRGSMGSDIELSDRMLNPERSLQATRYFFAPAAHSLKEGEGYASASYVLANVTYGITDNIMAGMSLSWLGAGATAKVAWNIGDGAKGSAGVLYQQSWDGGSITFPFANVTVGDENDHLTFAGGWLVGEAFGDILDSPMLNVSGCLQVADDSWIITENYWFSRPEFFPTNVVVSIGIRKWNARKQRLFEPAIVVLVDEDGGRPTPWASWTWPF